MLPFHFYLFLFFIFFLRIFLSVLNIMCVCGCVCVCVCVCVYTYLLQPISIYIIYYNVGLMLIGITNNHFLSKTLQCYGSNYYHVKV